MNPDKGGGVRTATKLSASALSMFVVAMLVARSVKRTNKKRPPKSKVDGRIHVLCGMLCLGLQRVTTWVKRLSRPKTPPKKTKNWPKPGG